MADSGAFNPATIAYAIDHDNVLYSNGGGIQSQTLATNFDASNDYSLTLDLGWRSDGGMPTGRSSVELWAGGTRLGFIDQTDVTLVEGELVSATLFVDGAAFVAQNGQALEIRLISTAGQSNFDNGSQTASDSLDFIVDDGQGTATPGTFAWTVSNVNDAPVVSAVESPALAYTENDGAVAITSTLTLADVDDTNLESAVVQITTNYVNGEDVLTFVDQNGITGSWDAPTGTLTLTGTATVAQYQAALQSITYTNTAELPDTNTRTVAFTVNDGTVDSNTQTRDITVASVNDDPINIGSLPTDVAVTEDVLSNVDLSAIDLSDVDHNGGNLTVTLTTSTGGNLSASSGGGVTVSGSGSGALTLTGTLASLNTFLDTASNIQYLHGTANLNGNDADTISVVVNDNGNTGSGGGGNVSLGTVNVDITAVNDDPANAGSLPGDIAVTEDVASNVDLSLINLSDVDAAAGNLTLTLTTSTGGNLSAASGGGITVAGSGTGVLSLTGTLASLNTFLDTASNIQYLHATVNLNGNDVDTISVDINDNGNTGTGGGTDIPLGTVNVDINGVNDAPVITSDGGGATAALNVAENTTAVTTVTSTDAETDTVTYSIAGGDDAALFSIVGASGELTFTAAPDFETPLDTDLDNSYEVTVQADDGNGGITTQALSITVTNANDAPTFDGPASASSTDLGDNETARQLVLLEDGSYLVAGYSDGGANGDIVVTRHLASGALDTTFGGGDGIVITSIGANVDEGFSIAVQADGKFIVVGSTDSGADSDIAVARYNANGALDTGFGTNGIVTIDNAGNPDGAFDIALQSDGKIVVVGYTNGGNNNIITLRLDTDGTLDTTFSGDGMDVQSFSSGNDIAYAVEIQADGKIVVGGTAYAGGGGLDIVLMRYNANGTLDTTFAGNGKKSQSIANGHDYSFDLAIQNDGRIVVAGKTPDGGNEKIAILRFNTDGSLDSSWSGPGTPSYAVGTSSQARSVLIQDDGKVLVAGSTFDGSQWDFTVVRYNSDGTFDTSFGSGGTVITDLAGGDDTAYALALDSDGSFIVAGSTWNGTDTDFAHVRYTSAGTLAPPTAGGSTLNGTPTYVENGSPVRLDTDVVITDGELDALNGGAGNYAGASLTLVRNGGANAEDVLGFEDGNGISRVGNTLVKNGQVIASFDVTATPGALSIVFTDTNGQVPTSVDVDNILQQLSYANTSNTPPASVQMDWTFNDGNTGAQGPGGAMQVTGNIVVTIQDTPDIVITAPATTTIAEDTFFVYSGVNSIQVDDGIATDTRLRVSLTVANGTLTLASTNGLTIVAGSNGAASLVIDGLESDINAALDGLRFDVAANYFGADTLAITTAVHADLQGYYTFEGGNANDQSAGTAHDGAFFGDATTVIDPQRGEVLSLDGTGDYVLLSPAVPDSQTYTLAAWINPDNLAEDRRVINLGNNVSITVLSNGQLRAQYRDTAGSTWFNITSTETVTLNQWQHVAFTVDAVSGEQKLYLNGVVVAQAMNTAALFFQPNGHYLGGNVGGATKLFSGLMDDALIYTRALSPDEISALVIEQAQTSANVSLTITPINDTPVVSAIEGAVLAYAENDGAVAVTSTLTLADVDDLNLDSAVVQITANYVNGEDVLTFVDQNGITGVWDA
ncbi:MAG: LamG-like jellyroll fold domain-containing protein, partial [Pseudomonadales bacterium]